MHCEPIILEPWPNRTSGSQQVFLVRHADTNRALAKIDVHSGGPVCVYRDTDPPHAGGMQLTYDPDYLDVNRYMYPDIQDAMRCNAWIFKAELPEQKFETLVIAFS